MKLLIAHGHLNDPSVPENTGMNVLIENGCVSAWVNPNEMQAEEWLCYTFRRRLYSRAAEIIVREVGNGYGIESNVLSSDECDLLIWSIAKESRSSWFGPVFVT